MYIESLGTKEFVLYCLLAGFVVFVVTFLVSLVVLGGQDVIKFKALAVHRQSKKVRSISGQAKSWADFTHLCRLHMVKKDDSLKLGDMIDIAVVNTTGIPCQTVILEEL